MVPRVDESNRGFTTHGTLISGFNLQVDGVGKQAMLQMV